jgi:hypothetical protein
VAESIEIVVIRAVRPGEGDATAYRADVWVTGVDAAVDDGDANALNGRGSGR